MTVETKDNFVVKLPRQSNCEFEVSPASLVLKPAVEWSAGWQEELSFNIHDGIVVSPRTKDERHEALWSVVKHRLKNASGVMTVVGIGPEQWEIMIDVIWLRVIEVLLSCCKHRTRVNIKMSRGGAKWHWNTKEEEITSLDEAVMVLRQAASQANRKEMSILARAWTYKTQVNLALFVPPCDRLALRTQLKCSILGARDSILLHTVKSSLDSAFYMITLPENVERSEAIELLDFTRLFPQAAPVRSSESLCKNVVKRDASTSTDSSSEVFDLRFIAKLKKLILYYDDLVSQFDQRLSEKDKMIDILQKELAAHKKLYAVLHPHHKNIRSSITASSDSDSTSYNPDLLLLRATPEKDVPKVSSLLSHTLPNPHSFHRRPVRAPPALPGTPPSA